MSNFERWSTPNIQTTISKNFNKWRNTAFATITVFNLHSERY